MIIRCCSLASVKPATYMKNNIMLPILTLALALSSSRVAQAQGTVYVSSLGVPSIGSASVGNDSWLAEGFRTGTNAGGYVLNSIQLALSNASGNPSGFTAMIYNQNPNIVVGAFPGMSVGTLNGSLDPVIGGLYTYTYSPASTLALSPMSYYFIVLTAGTAVADGTYNWSINSPQDPTSTGGWSGYRIVLSSSDGLGWGPGPIGSVQFAIAATDVPEPSTLGAVALGGLLFLWHRRSAKAVSAT